MNKFYFICIIAFLNAFVSLGQTNSPKYSNEFLFLGVGARSFGMAASGVAISDDATSGYWNPAGLMQMEADHQGILMHSSYFGGIANYDYGAFATSLQDSSRIAVSVIRFGVDDIPDTRFLVDANGAIDYGRIRYFSAVDYAFLISYARQLSVLGGLDVGGNVKVIHRIVGKFSKAWGFGLDAGAHKSWNSTQVGVNVRDVFGTFNTWQHNTDELRDVFLATGNEVPVNTTEITLPRLILGASHKIALPAGFEVLGNLDIQTTFDGKRNTLIRANGFSMDPILSSEVGFRNLVFLRFGAGQFQQTTKFSGKKVWKYQPAGGIGFRIREISIDYAMTDFANQAEGLYSHVFSIKMDFYAD